MLNNTLNHRSPFRTKNWVEINEYSHGTYNTNNQIKLNTSMLKSSLCDYSDAYVLAKGTITNTRNETDDAAKQTDKENNEVILKNCAPVTKYISKTNGTQIENAKDPDVVMLMYNFIEYSDNYLKT